MGEEAANNSFKFASELERVFSSTEFSRSPVMRRLLRFLIDQTLAGKGEQLKAYSVAVDGLGRDPDFDAQSDSYPRVQVGRLRRMLDAYYERYGLVNGERLVIPNGAYRVFLMPIYRNQERPSTPAVEIIAGPDPQDQADPILALKSARQSATSAPPYRRPGIILAVVLGCAILLFSAYAFFWGADFMRTARPGDMVVAPTMLLLPVERNPNSPVSLASSVDQTLGDALHRSWVVRTLSSDGKEATGQAANPQKDDHDYRLQSVLAGPEGEDLYLTLWDNRTNSRLWTGNVGLTGQEDNIGTALQIPLANLIGSFGAIATHQRRQYGDDLSPGYPCLLKNAELRIHPGKDNLEAARKCVDQMLAADPNSADALAAAVFVNYRLSAADPKHSKKWRDIALQQAKQAVLLDPYSANAQMAAASAAFVSGNCILGKTQGLRAVELNPYEPEIYARLGLMLFQCRDPDNEHYLTLAREMLPTLPAFFSLPIITAMAERGEADAALKLALSLPLSRLAASPYYAITMAIAYANQGDKAKASAYWMQVAEAGRAKGAETPRAILDDLLASPGLSRASGEALIRAGVINGLD